MGKKYRTFKQLTEEMNIKELNEFAAKVTKSYALSSLEYSQTNASEDNNLTKKGLRSLMDYAIIMGLVSRDVAEKTLEKAVRNQQRKAKEAGSSSIQHYKKQIQLREKNLSYNYSTDMVKRIASNIANDIGADKKPLSYYAEKYEIESDGVIKFILERAIAENIASDDETEAIIARSLKTEAAKKYFQRLLEIRNKNKSESSS